MPRVYTSENDALDFCSRHMPGEAKARVLFGNKGDGPDGRGNCFEHGAEHPPYDDEMYRCHTCGCRLGDKDE
jgi:hypothetical protein